MKFLFLVIGIAGLLIFILWLGLYIQPASFPPDGTSVISAGTIPLADSLPSPVKNFYSKVFGSEIPRIESAIISGRAKLRIMGISFPARFQFFHKAGKAYHNNIELTFFGFPIMKVREYYQHGAARLELPFGTVENEPNVDQGANLALWGEAIWYPSVFLSDPEVRWKPVDSETAMLEIPFREQRQQLLVRFDPDSGMPRLLEAMRYKEAASVKKTLWLIETRNWEFADNQATCSTAAITWFDEGDPWAVFNIEEVKYNLQVDHIFTDRQEDSTG